MSKSIARAGQKETVSRPGAKAKSRMTRSWIAGRAQENAAKIAMNRTARTTTTPGALNIGSRRGGGFDGSVPSMRADAFQSALRLTEIAADRKREPAAAARRRPSYAGRHASADPSAIDAGCYC